MLSGLPFLTLPSPLPGALCKSRPSSSSLAKERSGGGSSPEGGFAFDLDEYMVTLEKPLGIRFAQTEAGKIYVEALARNGNAENSQTIMVGDVLRKTSAVFGDALWDVDDFGRVMYAIKARSGPVSLVFERSSQAFHSKGAANNVPLRPWNAGHVGSAMWHTPTAWDTKGPVAESQGGDGNVGCVSYIEKNPFWRRAGHDTAASAEDGTHGSPHSRKEEVQIFKPPNWGLPSGRRSSWRIQTELDSFTGDVRYEGSYESGSSVDWSWPGAEYREDASREEIEWATAMDCTEYMGAVRRAADDLAYDHAVGMDYTMVMPQLYIGSCLQTPADVGVLTRELGLTAVLNLQLANDATNWGIDTDAIARVAKEEGLLFVNLPIKSFEPNELRMKLPMAMGTLHRLLRRGHHCYVASTAGMGRAPAVVIAYLHWICAMPFGDAYELITSLRQSSPNRSALVAATWDVIGLTEEGQKHRGPPTHAIQLVWNHGGKEVLLVGEFSGGWNQPIPALPAGGPKFVLDLRLPQGKYRYKYIVDGQWRHAGDLPDESDEWGNTNNVLFVGGTVRTRGKELIKERVIERPLTPDERRVLTYAAHRVAFRVNPLLFTTKR
eukprot:jgi/Mesen1/8328/ME000046S07717